MPNEQDVMLSQALLEDLRGEAWASAALVDLFVVHGRRPFRPRLEDLGGVMWSERGARQQFARAIAVLHVKGHIRWLLGGRYKIVSRCLLTVAEHRDNHPDSIWHAGAPSWKLRNLLHLRAVDGPNLLHLRAVAYCTFVQ